MKWAVILIYAGALLLAGIVGWVRFYKASNLSNFSSESATAKEQIMPENLPIV